jgi:hypothetical protein
MDALAPTTGTGHQLDNLEDLWSEILEAYLAELGLACPSLPFPQAN